MTKQTPTAFIEADFGQQTFESELADSNATATARRYTIGGYAGEQRLMGVFMQSTESDTNFSLNKNRVKTSFHELHLQFRLGYVSPSLIGAITDIDSDKEGERYAHILGSGYGAGLTVNIPITNWIIVDVSGKSLATPEAHDVGGRDVSVGRRTEFELGMTVDIIPTYLDLICGYRYRAFDLTIDSVAYKEKQSAPFAGARFGVYF